MNHPQLMADFVAPVYRDDASGRVSLRGPTMRVRAGEVLRISLRNNLTRPAAPGHAAGLNGFSHVADTNMHVHGMHAYPGARACGGGRARVSGCLWLAAAAEGRCACEAAHPHRAPTCLTTCGAPQA